MKGKAKKTRKVKNMRDKIKQNNKTSKEKKRNAKAR